MYLKIGLALCTALFGKVNLEYGIELRKRNACSCTLWICLIVPAGTLVTRILRKVLTVEIYNHTVNIEKISICLNMYRGREESVGNDDVSIECHGGHIGVPKQ